MDIRDSLHGVALEKEIKQFFEACRRKNTKKDKDAQAVFFLISVFLVWKKSTALLFIEHNYISKNSRYNIFAAGKSRLYVHLIIKLYLSCILLGVLKQGASCWQKMHLTEDQFIYQWCYIFLYSEEDWECVLKTAVEYADYKERIGHLFQMIELIGEKHFFSQGKNEYNTSEYRSIFLKRIDKNVQEIVHEFT